MAVFKADFGPQWRSQFESDQDLRMWKRRAYVQLRGIEPAVIVDGYGNAVSERRPYMPTLADLVDAVKRLNAQRMRAAERIEWAAAPKVDGLAGYVEHLARENAGNDMAERHIVKMRESLATKWVASVDERNARRDAAIAEHERLLATAPIRRRQAAYHHCAVPGCPKEGTHTHSHGTVHATWFCIEHWRRP